MEKAKYLMSLAVTEILLLLRVVLSVSRWLVFVLKAGARRLLGRAKLFLGGMMSHSAFTALADVIRGGVSIAANVPCALVGQFVQATRVQSLAQALAFDSYVLLPAGTPVRDDVANLALGPLGDTLVIHGMTSPPLQFRVVYVHPVLGGASGEYLRVYCVRTVPFIS